MRIRSLARLVVGFGVSMGVTLLMPIFSTSAQERVDQPDPSVSRQAQDPEIIVRGTPPISMRSPVKPLRGGGFALRSRKTYEHAQILANCAAKADRKLLRRALDGVISSSPQRYAQGLLVMTNLPCRAEIPFSMPNTKDMGKSLYERGAILEKVMHRYAPHIRLTAEQTGDREVQRRFNMRETLLMKDRWPQDAENFVMAICMVRSKPELASLLYESKPGSTRESKIEQAIILGSTECTGGAAEPRVDPTQFRIYILDALYRWEVAARGVASLIPADVSGKAN